MTNSSLLKRELEDKTMAKVLVAYFSATGTTGIAATALAEDLQGFQADVHHILVDLTGTDPIWILYTQQ